MPADHQVFLKALFYRAQPRDRGIQKLNRFFSAVNVAQLQRTD